MVDAKHIIARLDADKPDGVVNEAVEQIAFADRVLLNKIDLIQDDAEIENKDLYLNQIEDRIRVINCTAPIYRCKKSQIDVNNILNLDAFSLERVVIMNPDFLSPTNLFKPTKHDRSVKSCSIKIIGEFNFNKV